MLIQIARFEARYLLRNPLLWLTAAATFALFVAGMSVDGFDLGNEGGLLKNAAYAMLRNYVVVVGSSRVDLQACKLEYSIVSPK